ncbi:unnamed protein product, partial [Rotaria magnacalcarata]
ISTKVEDNTYTITVKDLRPDEDEGVYTLKSDHLILDTPNIIVASHEKKLDTEIKTSEEDIVASGMPEAPLLDSSIDQGSEESPTSDEKKPAVNEIPVVEKKVPNESNEKVAIEPVVEKPSDEVPKDEEKIDRSEIEIPILRVPAGDTITIRVPDSKTTETTELNLYINDVRVTTLDDDESRITIEKDGGTDNYIVVSDTKPEDAGRYSVEFRGNLQSLCMLEVMPARLKKSENEIPKNQVVVENVSEEEEQKATDIPTYEVVEGNSVNLKIEQPTGTDTTQTVLFKNGQKLEPSTRLTILPTSSTTIEINLENVKPDDQGTYSIQFGNTPSQKLMNLRVLAKPVIHDSLRLPKEVFDEGETLTIQCEFDSKPDEPLIWKLNGIPLTQLNDDRITTEAAADGKSYTLTVKDLRPKQHEGVYKLESSHLVLETPFIRVIENVEEEEVETTTLVEDEETESFELQRKPKIQVPSDQKLETIIKETEPENIDQQRSPKLEEETTTPLQQPQKSTPKQETQEPAQPVEDKSKPEPVEEEKSQPVEEEKPTPVEKEKPRPGEEVKPEPMEEEKSQPVDEEKPKPAEEIKPQPVEEETLKPADEVKSEPVKEENPQPVEEDKPKPTEDVKLKQAEKEKPQPAEEETSKPVDEEIPKPTEEVKSESVEAGKPTLAEEENPEPAEGETPEPIEEETPKPTEEIKPQPVEEETLKPADEVKSEPVKEENPQPVEEETPKPTEEIKPQPVEEGKPTPTEEKKPQQIEEETPKPAEEVKSEPVEQGKPKPVEEEIPKPAENVKTEPVKEEKLKPVDKETPALMEVEKLALAEEEKPKSTEEVKPEQLEDENPESVEEAAPTSAEVEASKLIKEEQLSEPVPENHQDIPPEESKEIKDTIEEQNVEEQKQLPQFIKELKTNKTTLLEREQLTIEAELDMTPNTVHLLLNGEIIPADRVKAEIKDKKIKFTLDNIKLDESGNFTVKVNDEVESKPVAITVNADIPKFVKNLTINKKQFDVGETLNFECTLNKPFSEIVWLKDGQPIEQDEHIQFTQDGPKLKLTIKNAQPADDTGTYSIQVKTVESDKVAVTVTKKVPKFMKDLKANKTTLTEGEQLVLECELDTVPSS